MTVNPVTGSSAPVTGTSDAQLRDAALGFEELLVRRLAQSLTDATNADGDESDGTSDATTQLLQSFLPDALAQSVKNAGGLGFASSLAQTLGDQKS